MNDGFTPASAPAAFYLAVRLIRYAARNAPPALAERLEEEWLADLAAQPSSFAGLSLAVGCCWATHTIAREHAAASAALSECGSKILTLDYFRSQAMTRFKWLWISVATLAVTALTICAVLLFPVAMIALHELAGRVPWLRTAMGMAAPAVGGGVSLWMFAWSWQQMRVRPIRDDVPKPPIWLLALTVAAASGALFALNARFGSIAMHHSELRPVLLWGIAVYFAVCGAGLLAFFCAFHPLWKRAGVL